MIYYSIEILKHYKCSKCNKWWSVGDGKDVDRMVCPHCGRDQLVQPIPISIEEDN